MSDFGLLNDRLDGLLASVEPSARRQLARAIATRLRASQAQRIAAQQNPDGTAFEPRRPRLRDNKGRVRRQMFGKLRTTRWLKTEASPGSAVVTFAAGVQHIARVHQYGLRDRVNPGRRLEVQYPARRLLGFTQADISDIEDAVLGHLAR